MNRAQISLLKAVRTLIALPSRTGKQPSHDPPTRTLAQGTAGMKLNPKQREELRMMFGGKCAYCGVDLDGKWHTDHANPVNRRGSFEQIQAKNAIGPYGFKWRPNGKLGNPEHDHKDNMLPSCIKCNILKSNANIEGFRNMLSYFVKSIPAISTYSHVHHLMRFGKLTIDETPVVFWFERYAKGER
jgi:hypothetical protein